MSRSLRTPQPTKSPKTLHARRFKVLSDEHRVAILEALLEGPVSVFVLRARLGTEQTLLSHHLRVLREDGLVECHREGRLVVYDLAPGVKARTPKSLELGCCRITLR
jgi:DNA-binding transcriptional ArsR family regulator